MKFSLPHRDDFPMDEVEKLTEKIHAVNPNARIIFAGDHPGELPPEVQEQADLLEQKMESSISEGICMGCEIKTPFDWPLPEEVRKIPDNWSFLFDKDDDLCGIVCPACRVKGFTGD